MKKSLILISVLAALFSNQLLADNYIVGGPRINLLTDEVIIPCIKVDDPGGELDGRYFDVKLEQNGNSYEFISGKEEDAEVCRASIASDVTDFTNPVEGQKNFTIDYQALKNDKKLTSEQKLMILQSLSAAPGYKSTIENLGSTVANCEPFFKLSIPVGFACNVTFTPDALKAVLSAGEQGGAIFICSYLDPELLPLKKICAQLIGPSLETELQPLESECGAQNSWLFLDFEIVPPTVSPKAGCNTPPALPQKVQCCTISKSNNCWSMIANQCPPGHERDDGFYCTGDDYCGVPWGPK